MESLHSAYPKVANRGLFIGLLWELGSDDRVSFVSHVLCGRCYLLWLLNASLFLPNLISQINTHKRHIMVIGVNQSVLDEMTVSIGCVASKFLFTYLGLPMGKYVSGGRLE
uniref:Uncharacterized protein n=1 Tax=Lactuca sativa TaxID=4236 RepID=A0A9R1WHG0_LACSA|nr:hypothetical protein LSAT_V11C200076880 [Lactuca sativa]